MMKESSNVIVMLIILILAIFFQSSFKLYIYAASTKNQSYTFIHEWGSQGNGNGQFLRPTDIAIDSSKNIYVVDSGNNRIQVFNSNGKFITKWGSQGNGNGQFNNASAISIESNT